MFYKIGFRFEPKEKKKLKKKIQVNWDRKKEKKVKPSDQGPVQKNFLRP